MTKPRDDVIAALEEAEKKLAFSEQMVKPWKGRKRVHVHIYQSLHHLQMALTGLKEEI